MTQLFKSFIPGEFLEAWARGQYVIGPRTLDYQYAGLALMLRGFYRYDVLDVQDNVPLFGGYAVADILAKELTFAGFRVYASGTTKGEQTPMFWKSVFSRFVNNDHAHDDDAAAKVGNNTNTELYFPYYVFPQKMDYVARQTRASINSFTDACRNKDNLDNVEMTIMRNGDTNHDDDASSPLPRLLYEIFLELFARAGQPAGEPALRGLCMFGSISGSRLQQRHTQNISDLELTGQNYGVVGHAIQGAVTFRRLTERFLETIERRIESEHRRG
jgi:hypothetical protein